MPQLRIGSTAVVTRPAVAYSRLSIITSAIGWMLLLLGTVGSRHTVRAFSTLNLHCTTGSPATGISSARRPVDIKQSRLFSTVPKADAATTTTSGKQKMEYPKDMTDDERYLFDLNGFIVVRGVLTSEQVAEANAAIDAHAHEMVERSVQALRNAVKGTSLYGSGPGRRDLGRMLEWSVEQKKVFASILDHPRLVPLFHGILGKGYRMDHLPMVLAQDHGAEGFQLHGGTIDCGTGEYNPFLAYSCMQGTIRSALLGCNVMLTDHNADDGGFCVVPGSHKSNFRMPKKMMDGELYQEFIRQPVTKAGDVVLFSEGTVHGAQAWTNKERQRRACLFRFAPATHSYGRSYFGHEGGGWPTAMYEGLTESQKAVLEPPYANRLDRPNIEEDGSVVLTQRSERKRQHDREVFGTKYF